MESKQEAELSRFKIRNRFLHCSYEFAKSFIFGKKFSVPEGFPPCLCRQNRWHISDGMFALPCATEHRHLRSIPCPVPLNSYLSPLSLPSNSVCVSLEAHLGKHLRLEPLPPIYSSFPPWKLALPVFRLDLAALPRSSNSTYLKHIRAIIGNEFSTHTLYYTDGSKSGTRTGYAFSINGVITLSLIHISEPTRPY